MYNTYKELCVFFRTSSRLYNCDHDTGCAHVDSDRIRHLDWGQRVLYQQPTLAPSEWIYHIIMLSLIQENYLSEKKFCERAVIRIPSGDTGNKNILYVYVFEDIVCGLFFIVK